MSGYFKVGQPYPPVPPFTWPEPGKPTWQAPEASFFGQCTGRADCGVRAGCPVGVPVTLQRPGYGCDCPCHVAGGVKDLPTGSSPGGGFP